VYKTNVLIFLLLFWSAVLLKYSVIASQSVTLGWDSSSDPDVAGYNVYYGTVSHQYTSEVLVGNETSVVIGGLVEGVTYYFAATTYLTSDQESGFSDEVPYTVPTATGNPPMTNNCVVGQNVFLQILTSGTMTATFEWKFNAMDIPSATNSILSLTNVTTDQAGTYSVLVSDDTGVITNLIIILAVYPTSAATLTSATLASATSASATLPPAMFGGGQFSFNVSGVPGFVYIVQSSTNLVDWESMQTNPAPFDFADADVNLYSQRFYRTLSVNVPDISITIRATAPTRFNPAKFDHPDTKQF
jgi:hypothetical protein